MIVFPAIDLVAGKVVRLERGDRSRMKVYSENPAAVARDFVEQGATWLHVVDLSAAFEEDEAAREANSKAIAALCQVEGISIDVGGGVRSLERIDELARLGAKRIAHGHRARARRVVCPGSGGPVWGAARGRCGRQGRPGEGEWVARRRGRFCR